MPTTRTASKRNGLLPEHVAQLRRIAATRAASLIAYELGRSDARGIVRR